MPTQQINYNAIIQKIWCGSLVELAHDINKHNVEMKVNDGGNTKNYVILLLQISEFKLHIEHPGEIWDYVELTEVDIQIKNKLIYFKCDLWSSGKIIIQCKEIQLNEH